MNNTYTYGIQSNTEEELELKFNKWIKEINENAKLINEIESLKITKLKVRPDIYAQWDANCNIVHSSNKLNTLFNIKLEIDRNLIEPYKFVYKGDEK